MRKKKEVTIPPGLGEDRDRGKKFLITEMAAGPAERWGDRALVIIARARSSAASASGGMAGVAEVTPILGGLQFAELGPLMDELLGCVQRIEQAPGQQPFYRALFDNGTDGDDIEEVATRQYLRREVLNLHVNFSLAAGILNWIAAASEMRTDTDDTSTFPPPSGP